MWKENLDLRVADQVVVRKGLLGDRIMNAVNKLLIVQFPHLQGLQSTLLSQTSLQPIQEGSGYIAEGTIHCHIIYCHGFHGYILPHRSADYV